MCPGHTHHPVLSTATSPPNSPPLLQTSPLPTVKSFCCCLFYEPLSLTRASCTGMAIELSTKACVTHQMLYH